MARMMGRTERDFMYALAMLGAARNDADAKQVTDYYCCRRCTPGAKQRSVRRARHREAQRWRKAVERGEA